MSEKINSIVFSNYSPKKLDIFLKSIKKNNINIFDLSILYKSDENSDNEYLSVFKENEIKSYLKTNNFKEDLLSLINKDNSLVSFFKDTNYFFSELPINDIKSIMSDDEIFCFSFGLGRNIKKDILNDVDNVLLNEININEYVMKFNWVNHYLSFGRPLELGQGHTFHKKEIFKLFKKLNYSDILSLEESFETMDYYPKECMCSFDCSVMTDVIYKSDIESGLKFYDFKNIDRNIIEI